MAAECPLNNKGNKLNGEPLSRDPAPDSCIDHKHQQATAVYSAAHVTGIMLALVGMALQWGFLHSVTFLGSVLGSQVELEQGSAWITNSLSTFLVFLVIFLASRKVSPLIEHAGVRVAVITSLVAGVALLVVGNVVWASPMCNYIGNVAIALGTTPMIVMWGELYKYLNPKGEQLLVTLVAAPLAIAIYLLETLLPTALAISLFAVLPLASLFCILRAGRLLKDSSGSWRVPSSTVNHKSPALLFVCIAVFSIPYNYLRNTEELQVIFANAASWSSVLAVAVVIVVGIALAEYIAERKGVLLVPGFVLFLLSAAMLMHVLVENSGTIIVPSLLYSGYYLFLAMVYLALGPIVATMNENPTRLFSGAMLANVAGLLLGSIMSGLTWWLGAQGTTLIVFGVTYTLLLLGFALLNSRSYSIFRVNTFDEEEYSFEYVVPQVFAGHTTEIEARLSPDTSEGQLTSMFDAIVQQCEVASERYQLSAREREVLVELSRGRTITSIAEDLVVSENTIKAHTKAIYRKLGVHTREELRQCVEEVSLTHAE